MNATATQRRTTCGVHWCVTDHTHDDLRSSPELLAHFGPEHRLPGSTVQICQPLTGDGPLIHITDTEGQTGLVDLDAAPADLVAVVQPDLDAPIVQFHPVWCVDCVDGVHISQEITIPTRHGSAVMVESSWSPGSTRMPWEISLTMTDDTGDVEFSMDRDQARQLAAALLAVTDVQMVEVGR